MNMHEQAQRLCEHRFGTISIGNEPQFIDCDECGARWHVGTHDIIAKLVNVCVSPDEPYEAEKANSWHRMRMDLWKRFSDILVEGL